MQTLEFHLPPDHFRRFDSGTHAALQSTLTVDPNIPTEVGNHLLIQEFDGPRYFTGRWIRTRIVDVRSTSTAQILTLHLIAKNSPASVRRRAN